MGVKYFGDYIISRKISVHLGKVLWWGVNQLERDLIRIRQREGIELAKKEGKFKFVKLQMCLGPHYIKSY